jgi:very-short-patch-repair endonuclease
MTPPASAARRRARSTQPINGVPEPDLALAEAAGVLPRERAAELSETRRQIATGRWRSIGGVVVQHNGPLTVDQSEWVALLRCGPGAVLAAWSAMAAAGARLQRPQRPQVVLPWTADVPRGVDADIRRTRLLGPTEVHPTRQPPQLRLARAAVDAASIARAPDDVRAQLCLPLQQRLLRPDDVRAAVLRVGPIARRALMLRTLDEIEQGATSVHELRFLRLLRRAGLPQPDRQVLVQRIGGRYYLDCWWQAFGLQVEIDGLTHLDPSRWAADLVRMNELELVKTGRRLRFSGAQLFEAEALVADVVRRALVAGGLPAQ